MKTVRFLFNDNMARAIVQGRKTVTRRPIVPQPVIPHDVGQHLAPGETLSMLVNAAWQSGFVDVRAPCAPGDILIGRECFQAWTGGEMSGYEEAEGRIDFDYASYSFTYRADGDCSPKRWRPSIHMPDAAARIRRRVVSVTVERLQDITEDDAVREGFGTSEELEEFFRNCAPPGSRMARPLDTFEVAWDAIYAAKGLGWDVNPWVWRIEFERENVREASNGR